MRSRAVVSLFIGSQGLRAGWGLLLFGTTLGVVTGLLVFIVHALVVRTGLSFSLVRYRLTGELELLVEEGLILIGVLVSTAVMARVEGRGVLSYGLGGPRALPRFLWGLVWGVVLLTALVGGLFASGHSAIEWGYLGGGAVAYGAAYALGLLVVALAEEMLLRGYLQVTLARLIGFWPAAGVLSLAFGLMHGGNPGESILGLVSAMLIGGVLCLSLRRSGSLWWAIGFHTAWDWAQLFLWGTPVSGFVFEGRLARSQALGDPLWSGGATGPEGSLLILPILALAVLVIVRSFRRSSPAERA